MNDNDLNKLLQEWKTPQPTSTLESSILQAVRPTSWWRRWASSEIRVPVPLGLAGLLAAFLLGLFLTSGSQPAGVRELDIRDFQTVDNLNPRVIRSLHEND